VDPRLATLRAEGLSFQEIGGLLGISKDAAQKQFRRWAGADGPSADGPAAAPRLAAHRPDAPRPDAGPEDGLPGPAYVGFDIGYFDLEATSLNGSFGRLHCGACCHVDGAIWEARIDEAAYRNRRQPSDDGKLAVGIRDHLRSHDILVSWNGKRSYSSMGRGGFDIPMLNARLVNVGEAIIRPPEHIDLLKESRRHLQLHSYRLEAVQIFLELQEEKTSITPRIWQRAMDYDKDALDYIADHCRRDVRVLRLVFDAFRRTGMLVRATR